MRYKQFMFTAFWSLLVWPCAAAPAAPIVKDLAVGYDTTCALIEGGQVKCWGANLFGQLGLGDTLPRGSHAGEMGTALPAVDLGPGRTAVAVGVGYHHACALRDDQKVVCWGDNMFGQLGVGDHYNRGSRSGEMGAKLEPVNFGTGRHALALSVGAFHNCALLDDSTARCWGRNDDGQLGLGDVRERGGAPGEIAALAPLDFGTQRHAVEIAAARYHTCALLDDASVKCWGKQQAGELGSGTTNSYGMKDGETPAKLAPVDVGTGLKVAHLAIGALHTCVLLTDNRVKCWGNNSVGTLGIGSTTDHGLVSNMGDLLPAVNFGSLPAVSVSCGLGQHCCAIILNRGAKCWGRAYDGQLGIESTEDRGTNPTGLGVNLPFVDLGDGVQIKKIGVGGRLSCALLGGADDGTVKCWGENYSGELGVGDRLRRGDRLGTMGSLLQPVGL